MNRELQKKLLPLSLTFFIVALDQLTKALVVANIKLGHRGFSLFGDFIYIIHVRNKGAAFSIGSTLPEYLRFPLLVFLPVIGLSLLFIYYWFSKELTYFQRWLFAAIFGGGLGNIIIDRIFRPQGVVDFISVKFYGLLGMERWPTFNVADASVVVAIILLFLSILFRGEPKKDQS